MKDTNSEKKRGRIRKLIIVVVVGGVAAVLVRYLLIGAFALFLYVISPQEIIYEMTEEEMELLIEEDPDDERLIREGKLYDRQARRLEEMRYGMSYLQEKYPGYEFRINYIDGWAGTFNEYSIQEESSGEYFKMNMYENEDGSFYAEDNFYAYFLEEKYDIYLEEQLSCLINGLVEINSYINFMGGKEYNRDITVDEIAMGKIKMSPNVYIHVSAKDMSEEECSRYMEDIRAVIEEFSSQGVFTVMFWDMTEEEMINATEYEGFITDGVIKKEENIWKIIDY